MKFEFIGLTDKGCRRKGNEDFFLIDECSRIAVVSDGMGGHNAGEIASETTSKAVIEYISRNSQNNDIEDLLKQAVMYANYLVVNKGKENAEFYGMGATVLVGLFRDDYFYYAWVGDSRIYKLDESGIHKLTKDHSYVQQLFDQGLIDEEEMFNHPRKNVLLSAIGIEEKTIDIGFGSLPETELSEATLLFCSDGLSDMLRDQEIHEVLMNNTLREGLNLLVARACEEGGHDNITVLGIRQTSAEELPVVLSKTRKNILVIAVCFVLAILFKDRILRFVNKVENRFYKKLGKKVIDFILKIFQ